MVPLSNDAVTSYIKVWVTDVINEFSHAEIVILLYQWDKSTDVAGFSVLHVLIHYQPQLINIEDLSWEHVATNTKS